MALRFRMLRTPLEWSNTTSKASRNKETQVKVGRNFAETTCCTFGCHIFHFRNCFCNRKQDLPIRFIVVKEFNQALFLRFAVLVHIPLISSIFCRSALKIIITKVILNFFQLFFKIFVYYIKKYREFIATRPSETNTVKYK